MFVCVVVLLTAAYLYSVALWHASLPFATVKVKGRNRAEHIAATKALCVW